MQQLPRTTAGRVQLAAAGVLVLLAFTGSAAARLHGAAAAPATAAAAVADVAPLAETPATTPAATPSTAPATPPATTSEATSDAADGTFTLGDLAAGRVPRDVQDRFWQGRLDAIRTAPCPEGGGAGVTTVTLFVGADEAWTDRLRAATAAHAAACAA